MGVISARDAQKTADEKQLDLVMVSPNANPPVCKIMDYGKYRFELNKREKEAKKHQKTINVKEVRLSAAIEDHDLEVKAKNADKFLKKGDKVKVSIRFRGRQLAHKEIGYDVMKRFNLKLKENVAIERKPKIEGRSMIMILGPGE